MVINEEGKVDLIKSLEKSSKPVNEEMDVSNKDANSRDMDNQEMEKNKKVKEQEIQKEVQKEDRSKEIYPYAGEKPQHRDLDADVRNELHRSSRSR